MHELTFHIGHHKTATTWLQKSCFSSHSQLKVLSNWKAPWDDVFLSHLIGSSQRTFDAHKCRELMVNQMCDGTNGQKYIVSAERLSGHPYSGGYDSFIIAERIHSCFPKAKIIITVRNQVDMIRSMYQQIVKVGYRGKFTDFLHSKHWNSTAFSMDFLEYDLLVSKYRELFSSENVLVLLFEDLKKDKKTFLHQISSFLKINEFNHITSMQRINASRKTDDTKVTRRINQFRKTELNPFPVISLPQKLTKILLSGLPRLFPFSKSKLINKQEAEYIKKYYAHSNKKLQKILKKDLPKYS